MIDHHQSPEQGRSVMPASGKDSVRVVDEAGEPPRRGSGRRRRKVFVAVLAAGLLSVGVAGAATQLLPSDGEVIQGGHDPEDVHPHGSDDQTVVARGVGPVAGPWRLTTLSHGADGEEPAGDCLQLLLTKPPEGSLVAATLLCQNAGKSEFKADSVPVVNRQTGESEILLFGAAPETAASVQLTVDGDKTSATELRQGPKSFPGDAWVVVVPSGHKTGELNLTDENGNPRGRLDASRYLDQLNVWERQLGVEK